MIDATQRIEDNGAPAREVSRSASSLEQLAGSLKASVERLKV
ncbi:MAG: hypothetical protein AW09_004334 [Candidatus Accumulibacter phosphatis]|uniref:Uncharacterized protein n=1 Tax=Candidatus Accumulibacter phosphatis TaxID=327160 RepID=A0A080LST3_9PROT|nr:hypothetical protein [Accumulibacter sp.]KFB70570.1 MAG: hypothetical protein AW09_004334 [Candidatus Accumulibacter phosphatis]HRF13622.1 hypothetical protein [Candidatus Accumulibacter phosphatis]